MCVCVCEAWLCRTSRTAVVPHRWRRGTNPSLPGLCAIGASQPVSAECGLRVLASAWFGDGAHRLLFLRLLTLAALCGAQVCEIRTLEDWKLFLPPLELAIGWAHSLVFSGFQLAQIPKPFSRQWPASSVHFYWHFGFQKIPGMKGNMWNPVAGFFFFKEKQMYELGNCARLSVHQDRLRMPIRRVPSEFSFRFSSIKRFHGQFCCQKVKIWLFIAVICSLGWTRLFSSLQRWRLLWLAAEIWITASLAEPHSLLPLIISEVSPESCRFFFPTLP